MHLVIRRSRNQFCGQTLNDDTITERAKLRQAAILNFNQVTIRFAICRFLLVVLWNRAAISYCFRDICIQVYLGHDLDLLAF